MAQNGSSVEQYVERAKRKASPWIERLVAAELVACGAFMFVGARYRRIETS